jgi:hypothetical protein
MSETFVRPTPFQNSKIFIHQLSILFEAAVLFELLILTVSSRRYYYRHFPAGTSSGPNKSSLRIQHSLTSQSHGTRQPPAAAQHRRPPPMSNTADFPFSPFFLSFSKTTAAATEKKLLCQKQHPPGSVCV